MNVSTAAIALSLLAVTASTAVRASGAPGPTGPAMLDERDWEGRFFVGSGFSTFKTSIDFDDIDYELEQQAIAVTIGRQLNRSWTLTFNVGLVLGGELELEDGSREYDIDEGYMLNLQVLRQWTFGQWFVIGELAGGFSSAKSAEEEDGVDIGDEVVVTGMDTRLGVMAGRRVLDIVRPYVVGRAFYGPVFWAVDDVRVTGNDENYAQLGVGINVDVPLGFSIGVEGAFLGELRFAVGVASKI